MASLRPYQQKLEDDARAEMAAGNKGVLLVLPTGGGKTIIFSDITQKTAAKGNAVLILVHRANLITQTCKSLTSLGIKHGRIAPSFDYRGETVCVASVQTLARRIKGLTPEQVATRYPFKLVIVDEAHHVVAGQWRQVVEALPKARILGVTATPHRLDGKGLGRESDGFFDSMVIGPTISWLIDEGYLTRPVHFGFQTPEGMEKLKRKGRDIDTEAQAVVLKGPSIVGDVIKHYTTLCDHAPAVGFCPTVESAQYFAEQFREAGYRAECLDGKTANPDNVLRKLAEGYLDVVMSCEMISEGTDVPVVTAAILLRRTDSESLYLQQVGRALRPVYAEGFDLSTKEGRLAAIAAGPKPVALILDHVGNHLTHGFAQDEREWCLGGVDQRQNRATSEDSGPKLIQCNACYAYILDTGTNCPICGATLVRRKPSDSGYDQVDGQLVALDSDAEAKAAIKKMKEAAAAKRAEEQRKARSPEALIRHAIDQGYQKPVFWAKKVLDARGQYASYDDLYKVMDAVLKERRAA